MTQPKIITKYLESLNGAWIERNALANVNTPWGFLPPRVERTIRGMIESNTLGKTDYKIEQKYAYKNGKEIAWVRAIMPIKYRTLTDPLTGVVLKKEAVYQ